MQNSEALRLLIEAVKRGQPGTYSQEALKVVEEMLILEEESEEDEDDCFGEESALQCE